MSLSSTMKSLEIRNCCDSKGYLSFRIDYTKNSETFSREFEIG